MHLYETVEPPKVLYHVKEKEWEGNKKRKEERKEKKRKEKEKSGHFLRAGEGRTAEGPEGLLWFSENVL